MCVYSMVMDHYDPLFPKWDEVKPRPQVDMHTTTTVDGKDLETLIKEFKEAVEAAKKIDILTKQPDCEDPEKAKLVQRVAKLEKQLAKLKTKKKAKKKK